jgi:predicted HAD superfamily Cof-like phosphohydrolase
MTVFQLVDNFHVKFGLDAVYPEEPMFQTIKPLHVKRLKFLVEETHETCEAGGLIMDITMRPDVDADPDFPKFVDGLLDTIYVAAGTLLLSGLSPDQCQQLFEEVQRANMSKERSKGDDDARSVRGSQFDVVKPEGFVPPDIEGLLRSFGWQG